MLGVTPSGKPLYTSFFSLSSGIRNSSYVDNSKVVVVALNFNFSVKSLDCDLQHSAP